MTKAQFITAIEAKSNFIKWASEPVVLETVGDVEKWHGVAYISFPDGTNTYNVFFMVDTATGNATWQQEDMLEPEKNTLFVKQNALANYLKANFAAYFLLQVDFNNNWAEAEVFTVSGSDLARSKVLVYKQGASPVTHKKIV